MTQWALIVESVVYEITDISPVGRFHPSMTWVQCDGTPGVAVNWTYGGGEFAAPAVVVPTAAEPAIAS